MTRRRRRAGRRIAVRAVLLLAATAAAAVIWLDRQGLPAPARDRLRAAIRQAGLDVDFTRLRLSLPGGVEASGVRVFETPASRRPRVEAAVVRIGIRWIDLLRRRPALGGLEVRDGTLLVGSDRDVASGETITGIRADLLLSEDTLDVAGMSGVWRDLSIRAAGRIVMARGADGRLRPPDLSPLFPGMRGGGGAPFDPARIPLAFPGGGQIEARFDLDVKAPVGAFVTLRGEGKTLEWGHVPFDGWKLSARLAGGRVILDEAALHAGGDRIAVSGSLSPSNGIAELRLRGSIPAAHAALIPLPPRPSRVRERLGLRTPDAIRLDVTLGPGPLTSLVQRVRGRLAVSRTELMGVWLESATVDFERNGPALRFPSIDGIVGRGAMAGPLHLEGGLDLPTGDYFGRVRTGFDPHALISWLDPVQSMHVGATAFRSAPPVCTAEAVGRLGDIRRLVLSGTVDAKDFLYNGALLASASARIQVSNQVLRLDGVRAVRPEGILSGWIEQDFTRRRLRFDIDSAIDPAAAARMCGASPHRFVSHFRTEGPTRIRARGLADYGNRRDNDATFEVEARSAGMGWLLLDQCAFQGRIVGRHITVTQATGAVYGGTIEGHAAFDLPDGTETRTHYRAAGSMKNVDFTTILRAVTDRDEQPLEGRVSARIDLAGFIGDGQSRTAAGSGSLKVEKGRLLEIPLFGGFSRHLARIVPGIGFTSQSDFVADFRIANGRASTDQAELQGDILTMRGRGSYGFDRSLDFVVEAKLLREGLIADVVRLLTLPVTKLLEYDLTGSITSPQWVPRNMPKEMLPDVENPGGAPAAGDRT
ncbi:MAG: hypothetical protein BWK77_00960 [Verrucomicrobia bacterium A1]|nr:MAG: hypothetical protein BWK77_00960 [Verrucomicrobia bacterium A1]